MKHNFSRNPLGLVGRLGGPCGGFSLVEILVSLAVIAILTALVVPTVSRQLEKGRATACVAKLRNLAVVMTQFRAERDQRMWNRAPVSDGGEGDIAPTRAFYRYDLITNARELQCPAATTSAHGAWKTGGTSTPDYMENIADVYVSYSVNGIAFYQNSPYMMSTSPLRSFLQFSEGESKTPLFMDGNHYQLNDLSWRNRFSRLELRHGEKCNVLFLDGHVETLNRQAAGQLDPYGGTNPRWMKDFGPG